MTLVNVTEAASLLNVSVQTIKRRIKNGALRGEQRSTPQGYVWLVDISKGVSDIPGDTPVDISPGISKEVERLEEIVTLLQRELEQRDHQIEIKDSQIEARSREVQELHVLVQQAQAALPAPREGRPWWRLW